MDKEVRLLRTAFCITHRCTLKCKLCLVFIPYFESPQDVPFDEAKRILREYFSVVDTVHTFTVTGGEPLMHKDLCHIMKEVYRYTPQITGSVDFVTNGTLPIGKELLELFAAHKENTKVVVSDYGKLSYKIDEVVKSLEDYGIPYRISNFHGDDLYYDGWIDFSDHSKKHFTVQERDAQGKKCIHRTGRYFVINSGQLHGCSRAFWRMKNGYMEKVDDEYLDLLNDQRPIEEKREIVRHMFKLTSTTSCSYCCGLTNDAPRQYPAEQLP